MKKYVILVIFCLTHAQGISAVNNDKTLALKRPFVYLNREAKIKVVKEQLRKVFESYNKNNVMRKDKR